MSTAIQIQNDTDVGGERHTWTTTCASVQRERQKESPVIMRPSSLGGGRILRRTLSVRLSVCLSVRPVIVIRRAT